MSAEYLSMNFKAGARSTDSCFFWGLSRKKPRGVQPAPPICGATACGEKHRKMRASAAGGCGPRAPRVPNSLEAAGLLRGVARAVLRAGTATETDIDESTFRICRIGAQPAEGASDVKELRASAAPRPRPARLREPEWRHSICGREDTYFFFSLENGNTSQRAAITFRALF